MNISLTTVMSFVDDIWASEITIKHLCAKVKLRGYFLCFIFNEVDRGTWKYLSRSFEIAPQTIYMPSLF